MAWRDPAQHDIGVSRRGLRPAAVITDRPRVRAGAFRSDMEQPACIEPGDGAATRANRMDVDERDRDRYAPFDFKFGGVALFAARQQTDIATGAAHVQR